MATTHSSYPQITRVAADSYDRSIPNIEDWRDSFDPSRKDWLILGKGPSYAKFEKRYLSEYFTCSLNHVVREHPVDLAHAIDIDVVLQSAEAIASNARFLILPYHPHENCVASERSIHDFVRELPVLQMLKDEGRLVWYNLVSSKKQVGTSPVIEAWNFSAEAAVGILASCGVRAIRSLGVDGGNQYASSFDDLRATTLLTNTQTSFDSQFRQIAKVILRKNIFYAPLLQDAPIRVFVGTDKTQRLAARVLEYSIKKYASMTAEVQFMCDLPVPQPKDPANRPRTGFSFSRFLIPSLCQYRGKAIYLDADMLVFDDIAKLWDYPLNDADVLCAEQPTEKGRVRQTSVLLLNCAKLQWNIEEIVQGLDDNKYDYAALMQNFCIVPPEKIRSHIPYEWNSLEHYEANRTHLIHYTDMPTQPWVCFDNRHGELFYEMLKDALDEGFISADELLGEIRQGHVHPKLASRVGQRLPWSLRLRTFQAPYKRLLSSNNG